MYDCVRWLGSLLDLSAVWKPAARKPSRGAFLALAFFLAAAPASAASVLIDFDFASQSTLSLLGGIIVTPPDGSIDTGSGQLSLEATSLTTFISGGQASLDQITFSATIAKNIGAGAADVSGPISGTQSGSVAGTLTPSQTDVSFPGTIAINLNANLACTGTGCASLGFPVSTSGIQNLSVGLLPITGLGLIGGANITADIPISLGGVLGTLHLVGIETNRSFVPEPAGILWLGLGWLALRRARR